MWRGNGPFGNWRSLDSTGPWISWWGQLGCPNTTWIGWTDSSWQTAPQWTSWSGCICSTTATTTINLTASDGATTPSVDYAVLVAAATTIDSSISIIAETSSNATPPRQRSLGAFALFLLSLLGMMT
jgi:hypothetical protein